MLRSAAWSLNQSKKSVESITTHRIHVSNIHLHVVLIYGKCRHVFQSHGAYGLDMWWSIEKSAISISGSCFVFGTWRIFMQWTCQVSFGWSSINIPWKSMFYPKGHQCVNCQKPSKSANFTVQFGRFHRLLNLPEDPIYTEPSGLKLQLTSRSICYKKYFTWTAIMTCGPEISKFKLVVVRNIVTFTTHGTPTISPALRSLRSRPQR